MTFTAVSFIKATDNASFEFLETARSLVVAVTDTLSRTRLAVNSHKYIYAKEE